MATLSLDIFLKLPISISYNTMTESKSYIVTLKETASLADISQIKSKISDLGGKIVDEFSLIKGFLVKLPAIHTDTIKDHDQVLNIEEDLEVKIQS